MATKSQRWLGAPLRARQPISLVAHCFLCEKKVTVHTLLSAAHLLSALSKDDNIEVMCLVATLKYNRNESATVLAVFCYVQPLESKANV
jgi:hypothetical protein